jgi:predicted TIM-barrel fold metal-dependent hydrolase
VAIQAATGQNQKSSIAKIIDTHTHLYDPLRAQGVPWPPKDDKLLYRQVLPKDYKALPKPLPVTGTVVVEASSWVEDNQWVLDLAKNDPFILGFVGNLPVGTDEFRRHLKRFAADRLFRGIRVGGGQLKAGLVRPRFLADLRELAELDLELDLLGDTGMLFDVDTLAREISTLRLMIDHMASLKIDGKEPPVEWLRGMETAARHQNVFCKISGLVEGSGRSDGTAPRQVEFYQPVLDVVWKLFGEDRLVYGSNWPVSERFAECATVQRIVSDYFETKGRPVLEKFFWKNAQAVYKVSFRRT